MSVNEISSDQYLSYHLRMSIFNIGGTFLKLNQTSSIRIMFFVVWRRVMFCYFSRVNKRFIDSEIKLDRFQMISISKGQIKPFLCETLIRFMIGFRLESIYPIKCFTHSMPKSRNIGKLVFLLFFFRVGNDCYHRALNLQATLLSLRGDVSDVITIQIYDKCSEVSEGGCISRALFMTGSSQREVVRGI